MFMNYNYLTLKSQIIKFDSPIFMMVTECWVKKERLEI